MQPPLAPTIIEVKIRVAPADDAVMFAKAGDLDLGASQNQFAAGAAILVAPTAANRMLTLRVPAFPSLVGWQYGGQVLRVGGAITFYSTQYVIAGTVASVQVLPPAAAKP